MTKNKIEQFLKDTFQYWYGSNNSKIKLVKEPVNRKYDASKFGEYIMPKKSPNFSKVKIKILELSEFIGKERWEVKDYLEKTYPNQLSGIDFWQYVYENPDKFSEL